MKAYPNQQRYQERRRVLADIDEVDRSFPCGDSEVTFRYSNRFWYYFIWLGGWMTWGVLVSIFGERITRASYPIMDRYGAAGFIGVMFVVVLSFVIWFLIPFFIARKVTDRQGSAYFSGDHVELSLGNRTVDIVYGDIEKLKYRIVLNRQHGGVGFGPLLYRLTIKTHGNRIVIPCSFKEAWECRKNDNAWPQISALLMLLNERTGIEPQFVEK
ncbi:MAG: hypothetical protein FWC54_05705 [Actinomycetia bacterium]|nr:hypothetical protein [Actinomycetes bacterium]